ncbi:hypothetical protein NKJ26_20110 [Mesorhizobium sp. M0152]|uniref:hypothetical protein n=1 Tax=Mesorhizobium sp. M0152 TaxID=2956898 RepID=UPI00333BB5AB
MTVTDQGLLIEFYKVSSFNGTTATPVLVDSYFVPTPAGRTPTIVNGGYVLNGTTGADYLWGLGGNDTLIGGKGNDLLVPGNQQKLFVFHKGDGQDTVINFVAGTGTGNVLDLRISASTTPASSSRWPRTRARTSLLRWAAATRSLSPASKSISSRTTTS